jgi:hypothetical protein
MHSPAPGTVIAQRYQVVEPLPVSGAAIGLRAQRLADGQAVVLELLPHAIFGELGPEDRNRAELARRLSHPNVASLIDYGPTAFDASYFVYEAHPGVSLAELVARQGPLPIATVADVGAQTLVALEAAQAQGLSHGGLKPGNLVLTGSGQGPTQLVVYDFGMPLAKPTGLEGTGNEDRMKGVSYVAPELLHGGQADVQSDIYALGLVLAEALSGQVIVSAASPVQITLLQASDKPVDLPPAVLQSEIGPTIISATRKPLARRADNLTALRQELERALAGSKDATAGGAVDVARATAKTGYLAAIPNQLSPLAASPSQGGVGALASSPSQAGPPAGGASFGVGSAPPPAGYPGAVGPTPPPAGYAGGIGAHASGVGGHVGGYAPAPGGYPSPHGMAPNPGAYHPHGGGYALGAPGPARPAPARKSNRGLIILLVVGALGMVALLVGGGILYAVMSEDGDRPTTSASPSDDDGRSLGGTGNLAKLDPGKVESRLESLGFSITGTSSTRNDFFELDSFQVRRDRTVGVVNFYRYESEQSADNTFRSFQQQGSAAAERDGTNVLIVIVGGSSSSTKQLSQDTLDAILKR